MSLPKITFTKGKGGLGRSLQGEDYISGFIFYDDTKPAGFDDETPLKCLNLAEAETAGIVDTMTDETRATALLTITSTGTTTTTLTLTMTDYSGVKVLGTYTSAGSLTTVSEAAAIASYFQTLNYDHGYIFTHSATTNKITVTAPVGKGIALNTKSLVANMSDAIAVTIGAFTGGVASKLAQYHYQVSEYFRLQPNGILWVMFSDVPTTYFATEILAMQAKAEGKIRQLAIFANAKTAIASADVTAINTAVNATETIYGVSLSVIYAVDIMAATNLNTLPDLSQLSANKVSVVISQSQSGEGLYLYNITGKSVPTLGATLGTVALSKVSEDIAWVGAYNISDGTECETIGFANGQLYSNISNALLEQLNGFRYIYLRKFIGTNGSFWNDSNCAIATSSDYAYIENNRTIDKAIRLVRTQMTPALNSPIDLNADGTLSNISLNYFKGLCNFGLELMARDGELSAYETVILATQNVLSTSKIDITINLVPKGVARQINITIGFTTRIG